MSISDTASNREAHTRGDAGGRQAALAARTIRERLMNPTNAVTDRPIVFRNGRPVPAAPVLYVEKRAEPVFQQPVDTHETFLAARRHLGQGMYRGEAVPSKLVSFADIMACVLARYPDVTLGDILSRRRTQCVVRPRQIVCYLARHLTGMSMPQIGRKLHRDHTTILCAVRVIDRRMAKFDDFAAHINDLKQNLTFG